MAKVKLLSPLAGAGFSHAVGEVVEVSDKEATIMVERGMAEVVNVTKPKRSKTATKPA